MAKVILLEAVPRVPEKLTVAPALRDRLPKVRMAPPAPGVEVIVDCPLASVTGPKVSVDAEALPR